MLRTMATCSVRFEFWCGKGSKKLEFVHSFPTRLVTAVTEKSTTAHSDAVYANLFLDALQPIIEEHEAACLATSNDYCGICGSPTVNISQIPMSWLHKPDDPYVALWVSAICKNRDCELQIRRRVQDEIETIEPDDAGSISPRMSVENIEELCRELRANLTM